MQVPERLSRFIPGNQVTLLHNGEAYFPAIEAAFDRASHEIFLETYIYEDDATGQKIASALKRAARRGVNVYVLIDGFGSKDLPRSMLDSLRTGGVKTLIYRSRISPWTFRRNRLRRLHRKITVVDREIAFVGGINIIDDRKPTDDIPPPYDYAVRVEGPLVDAIRLSARRQWSKTAWHNLCKGLGRGRPLPPPTSTGGNMRAAFLVRDNVRHRRDIEAAYLRAIDRAKSEIILANAYFLPGLNFRHALIKAAGRGVRVALLLQGRVEYFLQHYASQALYGHFLDAGIEIYEYRKSYLHAKVAVIDGRWATVGSSNLDPLSLLLAREANVVVEDQEFAAQLRERLMHAMRDEEQAMDAEDYRNRPLRQRFMEGVALALMRLALAVQGKNYL